MTVKQNKQSQVRSLIPLNRWNEKHMYPPERQLRYLTFTLPPGFESCVVRIGKRVLIDEEAFFRWVDQQQAN